MEHITVTLTEDELLGRETPEDAVAPPAESEWNFTLFGRARECAVETGMVAASAHHKANEASELAHAVCLVVERRAGRAETLEEIQCASHDALSAVGIAACADTAQAAAASALRVADLSRVQALLARKANVAGSCTGAAAHLHKCELYLRNARKCHRKACALAEKCVTLAKVYGFLSEQSEEEAAR